MVKIKIKVKNKEFEIEENEAALILAIQELTYAIKNLSNI